MNYDNELVHQKNAILDLINAGKYEEAILILNFNAELWDKLHYGYKTNELRQRIRQEIFHKIGSSTHHKTEAKWQRLLNTICA